MLQAFVMICCRREYQMTQGPSMPTSHALSQTVARWARPRETRFMAVVKVGLTALVLVVGTLAAAEGGRAQTATSAARETSKSPMAQTVQRWAQAQPQAAQPSAPAASPAAPAPAAPQAPAATPGLAAKANPRGPVQEYNECLNLWDAATHMTRAEWAATCRRIQTRLNDITVQANEITAPGRRRAR
jgi:hypothetical protein